MYTLNLNFDSSRKRGGRHLGLIRCEEIIMKKADSPEVFEKYEQEAQLGSCSIQLAKYFKALKNADSCYRSSSTLPGTSSLHCPCLPVGLWDFSPAWNLSYQLIRMRVPPAESLVWVCTYSQDGKLNSCETAWDLLSSVELVLVSFSYRH